jgi:hypothetical protein
VRYAVKRIDEIPGVPDADPGDPDRKPLRHKVRRRAVAVEPVTAMLAIGGAPGRPYEISSWDAKWTTGLQQA